LPEDIVYVYELNGSSLFINSGQSNELVGPRKGQSLSFFFFDIGMRPNWWGQKFHLFFKSNW